MRALRSRATGSGNESSILQLGTAPESTWSRAAVAARWTALYRLSYLLTASPAAAEDLLQTSLEKAYVRWGRIVGMEYAEAYVRRAMAGGSEL